MPERFGQILGLPKPQSDAELEIASERYFGTPLHLKRLDLLGGYEVAEDYDSYNKWGGNAYDEHGRFWAWAIGELSCGGTARASYGQFKLEGHRHRRRLKRWIRDRHRGDSRSVRTVFEQVSRSSTGAERTPRSATKGVLSEDRVDGAEPAFFCVRRAVDA